MPGYCLPAPSMTRDLAYLMHLTSALSATVKIYDFELQPLLLFTRPHPTPRARASNPHQGTCTCFHQCTFFYTLPPEAPHPPFFTSHIDNHYESSRFPSFDNPHAPFPFGPLHLRSTTIRSIYQHRNIVSGTHSRHRPHIGLALSPGLATDGLT